MNFSFLIGAAAKDFGAEIFRDSKASLECPSGHVCSVKMEGDAKLGLMFLIDLEQFCDYRRS